MTQLRVLVVALALGVLGARPAMADWAAQGGTIGTGTIPLQTITCTAVQSSAGDCSNLLGPNRYVLGFKLISGSGSSTMGLYDAAAISGTTGLFDEIYEATAGETDVHIWPRPYKLTTALSISVQGSGATGIVYYQ